MPKSAKRHQDPYRKRKCKLCKLEFSPTTKVIKNAEAQEFCCEAHRKEFWKYGALPFAKLMARIERMCREIVAEEISIAIDTFPTESIHRNFKGAIQVEIAAAFERCFNITYCQEVDGTVLTTKVPWDEIAFARNAGKATRPLEELERAVRVHKRLTGKGPIGREAAQALIDSFAPGLQKGTAS